MKSDYRAAGYRPGANRAIRATAAAAVVLLVIVATGGCALFGPFGIRGGLDHELPLQDAVDELIGRLTPTPGGIAVAVDRAGEALVRSSTGKADRDGGAPFTVTTPTYTGSISKPITAAVILTLHQEGVLSLDAPLSEHLDIPSPYAALTARQLLTHQAGVTDWIGLAGGRTQCLNEIAGTTNEEVRRLLVDHGELDFAPGSGGSYSNGGYVLLSLLAEAASGQSMHSLVSDRIAAPLGLSKTWVIVQGFDPPEQRAIGTKKLGAVCDYNLWTTGAGGVVSSATDLLAFAKAWQDASLIPPGLRDEALSPSGPPLADSADGHGLGWFVGTREQGKVAWHTGHYGGFANVILIAPEADLSIVALSNGSTPEVALLAEEILSHPDLR